MGMSIDGLIKRLQDMLLLYNNKTILTISDGENEYDIKSITGKPCAKYFEPKDNVAEVTITVEPTVEAIPKADYENRLKADMVAMLTDIQLEIEGLEVPLLYLAEDYEGGVLDCKKIIQQKIDALKGEQK